MHHHLEGKGSLSIAYDGPGLVDGAKDICDLAPAALLAVVSELYSSTSRVLYRKTPEVKINVSATVNGWFEVVLDLVMLAWDKIVDIFTGDSTEALKRLITIISETTGLFVFYKMIKGRKISAIENLKYGKITITSKSDRIEIEKNLYDIYTSLDTQIAIQKLVEEPLRREGIENFNSNFPEETITVTEGDTLVCEVSTTQTVGAHGRIKSTHVIEHVIKHAPPTHSKCRSKL